MATKKVLILGVDGYIGWALACDHHAKGHTVFGIDDFSRRELVKEVCSDSAIEIENPGDRWSRLWDADNRYQHCWSMGIGQASELFGVMRHIKPDIIYHLAQMPSAPFSMKSPWASIHTYSKNVQANLAVLWGMRLHCPDAHLVKLGTMGEYGTPEIPIPEGEFPQWSQWVDDARHPPGEGGDDLDGLQFPRKPGSIYHSSKVADSVNCEMLARLWDLRISDIMQGVVYGTRTDTLLSPTRLDIDEAFGTVINRFCAQAVLAMPLTVYGQGGQTRGFLPLRESVKCLQLVGDNPPKKGRYEVYNQFGTIWSVNEIAEMVQKVATSLLMDVKIDRVNNPRKELEKHEYEAANDKLRNLGYKPSMPPGNTIMEILQDLQDNKAHLRRLAHTIKPTITWK
jgi:UDP-sulfoquinovose synthase